VHYQYLGAAQGLCTADLRVREKGPSEILLALQARPLLRIISSALPTPFLVLNLARRSQVTVAGMRAMSCTLMLPAGHRWQLHHDYVQREFPRVLDAAGGCCVCATCCGFSGGVV